MKDLLSRINRDFENRVRLGIMSMLMVQEWVAFKAIREMLHLTDGNLASHISALEKSGYVEVRKEFVGRKPKTSYRVTASGRVAFKNHLDALEELLKGNR